MSSTHFSASSQRFIFLYLQKVGHGVANVKIYKCIPHFFCASSYSFRYIYFLNDYLQKVVQGHGVKFS